LLKHIEEFDRHILITGLINVKITDTKEFLKKVQKEIPSNVEIQFFDAQYVVSWEHLYFAALNALTAFKNKRNISKSLAVETMLYASAQRQIRKAMVLVGISPRTSEMAVLIIGKNLQAVKSTFQTVLAITNMQPDDAVLELSEEKKAIVQKTFGISDLELKTIAKKDDLKVALTALVIERMALLTTKR
jgi:tRNA threonylcarbamoyladenosine modification (KEOPS) complex Cgi121 subunit